MRAVEPWKKKILYVEHNDRNITSVLGHIGDILQNRVTRNLVIFKCTVGTLYEWDTRKLQLSRPV
jgi:hypothetical protein